MSTYARIGVIAGCGTWVDHFDCSERLNDIAILNVISLPFARDAVLARQGVKRVTLVLQIVGELVHHQTCPELTFNIAIPFIDIDNVSVVIPTNGITLLAATDILDKKRVLLEPDFGRISRYGIARQIGSPAQKYR